MHFCKLLVALLACLSTAQCFNCPQDNNTTFHADVSTNCQEYHICKNSEHSILSCPTGQAFSTETLRCEAASNVVCNESIHHHHKRSVEEEVHIIDIQNLKANVIEVYHAIKPIIADLVYNVAPTLYEKFAGTYLPALRSFKKEVWPFIKEKIYPIVQKWFQFFLSKAHDIVERLYRSYQLSTSTHIAIVSMEDIAVEIAHEVKPLVNFGKYLASKAMRNNGYGRYKRDVESELALVRPKRETSLIMELISPFVNNMIQSFTSSLFGNEDSLLGKVLLPTLYDIFYDAESRYDVMKIVVSAKSAFTPLLWRMMKEQVYNSPSGPIIKIERAVWNKAYNTFIAESWPEIMKLVQKHYKKFMMRMAESGDQILGAVDQLVRNEYQTAPILKDHIFNFIQKHKGLFKKSTSEHVFFYPVPEILADLQPIKVNLLKVFLEYLRRSPNSILNMFFGENSVFMKSMMGSNTFAVPAPQPKPAAQAPQPKPAARPYQVRNLYQRQRG